MQMAQRGLALDVSHEYHRRLLRLDRLRRIEFKQERSRHFLRMRLRTIYRHPQRFMELARSKIIVVEPLSSESRIAVSCPFYLASVLCQSRVRIFAKFESPSGSLILSFSLYLRYRISWQERSGSSSCGTSSDFASRNGKPTPT